MFPINVNSPRPSISVDEGEAKINGPQHLPLQHLGLVTTEIESALFQHEEALSVNGSDGIIILCVYISVFTSVCVCVCVCVCV